MKWQHETETSAFGPVRVLIVDDHELAREALRSILSREADFQLVGEARDGAEAIPLAHELRPDVVVMDIRMPALDGLAATRAIKETLPAVRVILLTSYDNPEYVFQGLRSGADGYLSKGATKQEVLTRIRECYQGELVVQQSVASEILRKVANHSLDLPSGSRLSRREQDVLHLMAVGLNNKEIAARLRISLNTVKTHVSKVVSKLEAVDRTDAAVRAARLGLLGEQ